MAPADPTPTAPARRFGLRIEEFKRAVAEDIARDHGTRGPLALLLRALFERIFRMFDTLRAEFEAHGHAAPSAQAAAGEDDSAAHSGRTGAGAVPGESPLPPVSAHAGKAGDAGAAQGRAAGQRAAPAAPTHDGRRATAAAVAPDAAIPISTGPRAVSRGSGRSPGITPAAPRPSRSRRWRVHRRPLPPWPPPHFADPTGQRLLAS